MRARRAWFALSVGVLAAAATSLAATETAAAEGLFESLFGGFRRAIEHPSHADAFADPSFSPARPTSQRSETDGPAKGFCVRTCDGRYFPVQASAGASAAEMCHAFCPSSDTKVYSGSNIDYATGRDGGRYADLPNAYLYRKQIVSGCTCNGRDAFGLAHINVTEDPTLKPGDVVATKGGLVAYSGGKNKAAEFTPVQNYSGFSKSYRQMLSELKLMPPNPGAPKDIVSSITPDKAGGPRSAQLER